MRDALAERLLAGVMQWTPADVASERPILQALALLKYDEYQQFSPGMRFVESLGTWLEQFEADERQIAYDFIRSHLIFLSEAEMAHFAAIAYPDFVRPRLLSLAASIDSLPSYRIAELVKGPTFARLQGSTLFFGLSDGARIDQFRRSNRELSHEQIFPSYELSADRVQDVRDWLTQHNTDDPVAGAIVLVDDFAGSGLSYVREDEGKLKGKIVKFLQRITASSEWQPLMAGHPPVLVALYVATEQAIGHIHRYRERLQSEFSTSIELLVVQTLRKDVCVKRGSNDPFCRLVEKYYDQVEETDATAIGGSDIKYGFAECSLPLVLHHNTPNNSLFLLWVESSETVRPLFQRFSRHRRES